MADLCITCRRDEQADGTVYCEGCLDRRHREQDAHRERAICRLSYDCPRLTTANWKTYEIDDDNRDAVAAASNWQWSERDYNGGVYLWGPVGTGKTHLAYLIAQQFILAGYDETARLVVLRNLLNDARAAMTRGDNNPLDELVAEDISVLVLDDLGAERPTDWSLETVSALIENRYMRGYAPIIVTSNYAPSQLAAKYAKVDPVAAQRIVSRLTENTLVLKLDGPDRRILREAA